ncbi:MAG: histidinol dehydrogenase, partial [Planctomycetes bacterium]|nr:histidinol dehydrogenase [Planctomycetota bacterium]
MTESRGAGVSADRILRLVAPRAVAPRRGNAVDAATLARAAIIVEDVRLHGETALRRHARRLGDLREGERLVFDRRALARARDSLPAPRRALLSRAADRIRAFALAQRACLSSLEVAVPGGRAGHTIAPVARAGCYAPGGRYPLPSSVLMTCAVARAAGVPSVWAASPHPTPLTLAAAAVAGAEALLAVGGAQAIAALAFGAGPAPACDAVVGPGNRWVTAAKQLVAGRVAIDMLAGPSELVVLAGRDADPGAVAADLLAQAEHDVDALPVLIALGRSTVAGVEREMARQLETLPTADVARVALARNGYAVVARNLEQAAALADRIAPEHLHLHLARRDLSFWRRRLNHYGALFLGGRSAEVFGDYGAGPNHVLPTGGTARFSGGLSVFTFLRVRTWLDLSGPPAARDALEADAASLARLEG